MYNLAITPQTLYRLSNYEINKHWFEQFELPIDEVSIRRVVIDDTVYLFERHVEDEQSPLIVINNTTGNRIFSAADKDSRNLERIITVARAQYTDSVSIPQTWKPHYEDDLFSISVKAGSNWKARLHFLICHPTKNKELKDLFVFSLLEEIVDFHKLEIDKGQYGKIRENFIEAILSDDETLAAPSTDAGIVLTERLPQGFVQGGTLDVWYQTRLTKDQRAFVDKPHDNPVRLRGAAGTGKTLSLVIKFLKDATEAERTGTAIRYGFLTHSKASVDFVNAICESLDPVGLTLGGAKHAKLEIRTLYDLASNQLALHSSELTPLELDGRKGRLAQREIVESLMAEMWQSTILRARYKEISPELFARWDPENAGHSILVNDVAGEFASVIDAEGIKPGSARAERYAKNDARRAVWLMPLATELDRRFILEIHAKYCKELAEMKTLSIDQMVADFDSYLDSNGWAIMKSKLGYDALFVDELHLFTSVERQCLHKLIRKFRNGEPQARPAIFMAYDIKQSPTSSFASYFTSETPIFTPSSNLQNSDLIQLQKVFRYTPEITELLRDIDASFPAIDVPGEWNAYVGESDQPRGDIPTLQVHQSPKDLMRHVFEAAHDKARLIKGGGRRVAVLCLSEEMFDTYSVIAAGQYSGKFITISSREPASEFRYAGKRFIFSMAEYVAGLQFDTVFIIHADRNEAPIDSGVGVRRSFISNLYLGASRAERVLTVHACLERGGVTDFLQMALDRGALREV
ncbi:UvrD-helicase domain-containing protein [Pseudomonas alliivorans]|nr:UvrD-helicase domain-containing protein [Pseudomonas alliivorans]